MLKKLIKRPDVDALVNACDAGREGELIFRNIVKYTKAKQPIKRLWLQSMTPAAIREGFEQLREDKDMLPLADAAYSRSEADWLVGINGTRAMTAFNSKLGGFFKTTVGRVQTPTLAIVVEREAKIRKFVSRDYLGGHRHVRCGRRAIHRPLVRREVFQVRRRRTATTSSSRSASGKRPGPKPSATNAWASPASSPRKASRATSLSPLLYDLTSLQREANSRFGFSAKNTLGLAQALYERHKVLTYPRTDSRALPEDYLGTVKNTLKMLGETRYATFADTILKNDWVHPNKRIFNNAKVSDHFAIIPTTAGAEAI